ncbi:MAG TPA: cytochrome P450 [Novosphingobium sp.]
MTIAPKLRDFDDAEFNPFMSDDLAFGNNDDPYPLLAKLREESGGVVAADWRTTMGLYPDITQPAEAQRFMALSAEAVQKVLQTPDVFGNGAYAFNLGRAFGRSISTMDAPEHGQYRRIFQKVFLPQYVREWGGSIVDPVVDDLMQEFQYEGKADLVQQFTIHYPFRVVYRQLGLPQSEGTIFHKLAIAQTLIAVDTEHAEEASRKLGEYFKAMIDLKRREPGEDLLSLLVHTQSEGDYLPDEVLISFFRQLLNAAADTTYRGTGVLLTMLLSNPDQLEMLRNDRSLLPNAIEEALRFDGPVLVQDRFARVDSDLCGVHIPAGSVVQVVAGAANRDPRLFQDPDRFDITRPNAKAHFSFSQGPHICVGQHLARVEMTRALTAILDRLHNLRLDPDMPKPVLRGATLRRSEHLYVRFDPVKRPG